MCLPARNHQSLLYPVTRANELKVSCASASVYSALTASAAIPGSGVSEVRQSAQDLYTRVTRAENQRPPNLVLLRNRRPAVNMASQSETEGARSVVLLANLTHISFSCRALEIEAGHGECAASSCCWPYNVLPGTPVELSHHQTHSF